jgi:transcriptional regulator PpsR
MLVSVANDIALVMSETGVIQKVVLGGNDAHTLGLVSGDWVGRSFCDTVTSDTRKKVDEMLRDVAANGVSRLRHLNHPNPAGPELPFAYTTIRLGMQGPLLAVGRDLRTVVAMQQRYVSSQQEMERHYWKMRQAESRYRLLFQIATDAVFVIDTATLSITDANNAAARLFGMSTDQLVGKSPTIGIEPEFAAAVESLLTSALSAGRNAEVRVRLLKGGLPVRFSASPYVSQGPSVLLLRAQLANDQLGNAVSESRLLTLVERTGDAIVVADQNGNVILANPAFARLLEVASEDQVIGRPLGSWLGTAESRVPATISLLIQNGVVPLFVAALRTETGRVVHVELSATLLPAGDESGFGFIMRPKEINFASSVREHPDSGSSRKIH